MPQLISLLGLVLFANLSLAQNRPISELRSPTWLVRTSCLTEIRQGKQSCWGIVIDFDDARFKTKISSEQLKIYEAKHGTSLLRLMTWHVSRDGKQLIIKFKPGMGDFGTGNRAEVTLYKTAFITPPKQFPNYAVFVQNTDQTNNASANEATKKCARVTRATIEQKFGKPIKCTKDAKEVECYGSAGELTKVRFDSADVVVSIEMFTGNGLDRLTKVLDEILPKNSRGKILQEPKKSPFGSCTVSSEEEYQCITINYFQQLCMDSAPASIRVVWK
jgi:hypothetical protein